MQAKKLVLEGGWGQKRLFDVVGQMKVSAKHVTKRKAQKSTGSTLAQNETKSDMRSQRLSISGSKKGEPQRMSGNGKEVPAMHPLSEKPIGTEVT